MRISDWSSDVCSSDLIKADDFGGIGYGYGYAFAEDNLCVLLEDLVTIRGERAKYMGRDGSYTIVPNSNTADNVTSDYFWKFVATDAIVANLKATALPRSEEHTSELQSLMRISYAVFCLKKKKQTQQNTTNPNI